MAVERDPEQARLIWPWRSPCRLRLLADGHRFLPHIRSALAGAHSRIDIELYICASGALFDEWYRVLSDAVERGVRIRMVLDAVGSRDLSSRDCRRLEDAGIELHWFNPASFTRPLASLVRDHRKLILVDGERAWTGGMGILDEYDPRIHGNRAWLDAMVECRGPVVDDWGELFEQVLLLADNKPITRALRWRFHHHGTLPPAAVEPDITHARVMAARGGRSNPLLRTLVRQILRARRDVWLCTPYFWPPRPLFQALLAAARRGVRVRLTVAGPETDNPPIRYAGRHLYTPLLEAGVEIAEYRPRFMHLKAARVDSWSTLGSFNFDHWNSSWNLEANIEVVNQHFARTLEALRLQLERDCEVIDPQRWARRGPLARSAHAFWYWLGMRLIKVLKSLRETATAKPGAD
jgi:phosphatidylserine/phosphatidylglycerophosphate/cardiolipin synthase-like enzyme